MVRRRRAVVANGKTIVRKFNSLSEYDAYLESGETNKIFAGSIGLSTYETSGSFEGTKTWEEATNLMMNGDKERHNTLKSARQEFRVASNAGTCSRRTMVRGVAGFMPNVPAAVMNMPQAMFAVRTTRHSARVLDVMYSPTANCNYDASEIDACGMKVAKAVYHTEAKGVRVNLWIVIGAKNNEKIIVAVRVKTADQYGNLLKAAYPLAHPSFLRRQFLRAEEIDKELTDNGFRGGHGYVMPLDEIKRNMDSNFDVALSFYDVRRMSQEDVNAAFEKKK
jgi:hypothetical protein